MLGHGAVRGRSALHQVRLHEIAAVDAGADSRDELQRRDVEGLPEAGRGELAEVLRVAEHVLAPPDAAALAAEVYARRAGELRRAVAGALKEAEGLGVVVEPLLAYALADVHEGHVAAVLHRLGQRLRAVTAAFPAADGGVAPEHRRAAAAVEAGVHVHDALLERHGQRYDLEGRARLIRVRDGLVPPLELLGGGDELRALGVAGRCGVYLGHGLAAYRLVVVEVKVAQRRHC